MTLMKVNFIGEKKKPLMSAHCIMIVRLIIDREIKYKGVIPPEILGKEEGFACFIFSGIQNRGVLYKERIIP